MLSAIRKKLAALDTPTLIFLFAAAAISGSILKDALLPTIGMERDEFELLQRYLARETLADSWWPMRAALNLFRTTPDAGLFETIFFEQRTKFQYPPTSILPFVMLDRLGVDPESGFRIFRAIIFASVLGCVVMSTAVAFAFRSSPALKSFMTRPLAPAYLALGAAAGTLSFYPIMYAYTIGQIQLVIDLAVCVALWAWVSDRKRLAGASIAVAALIKPHYALLFIWSLLRREHQFAIAFAVVGISVGLASLYVFGFSEHIEYLKVISYIGRHGEVYWPNQSMNGLLHRLFGSGDPMEFTPYDFAPFRPAIYAATLVSSLLLVALALGYRPRWRRSGTTGPNEMTRKRETTLDLSTSIVALTMASPVAWEHHYGTFWPVIIVTLMVLAEAYTERPARRSAVALGLLGAAYLLISNYFTHLRPLAYTPFNVLQSYIYFGGLLLLGALIAARSALGPTAPTVAATSRSLA